jgi:hypothetical protein
MMIVPETPPDVPHGGTHGVMGICSAENTRVAVRLGQPELLRPRYATRSAEQLRSFRDAYVKSHGQQRESRGWRRDGWLFHIAR